MNQIQKFNYRPQHQFKDGFTSFDKYAYLIAIVILLILGVWGIANLNRTEQMQCLKTTTLNERYLCK